ncbi:hypothetical protein [Flavobacterium sp.]|jgi:hypothetical protein|uniref:hypothetical protein n=1 Tax=Flavobacterium sp. TaxID=239 RepID=UPI0037C19F03
MTRTTILLLILSVFIAGLLSFYQYVFKVKKKSNLIYFLAFLRGMSWVTLFWLLINPVVSRKINEIQKTPLPVVIDNSKSISELKATTSAKELYQKIKANKALADKYDVQFYSFDASFEALKQLDFKGKLSDIDGVSKNLKQLYRNKVHPVVLITDGNQTLGNDYVFSFKENATVYPIVLGDTSTVVDLKINQINVNKYAFFKNKFPVEVLLLYNGDQNISSSFTIEKDNQLVYKQQLQFSKSKTSQTISFLLDANSIGSATYKATLASNIKEKNTYNNSKKFAVDIIDQRSEIALVSTINHPDISALKRSIEVNQQRKVTIVNPNKIKSLQNYNLLLLYQPNPAFQSIFEQNKIAQLNTFIITGTSTDFNFLNQQQNDLQFKVSDQNENYLAYFESDFNLFGQENIGFEKLPPLEHKFGTIVPKTNTITMLFAGINGVQLQNPLLTFAENANKRTAYLVGENIWKWRLDTHLTSKSFVAFDLLTDKIIQFLATPSRKNNLAVTYDPFYNLGENIVISASYFNKNYEFDTKAQLTIVVKNTITKASKTYDLLKTNSQYQVNLDGLLPGNYAFTISVKQSNAKFSGAFEVADFDLEKQFVNPDNTRLTQLSNRTKGAIFYPNQLENLLKQLEADERYLSVQKQTINKSPLIEWKAILVFLISLLALEWFVRKYFGLL